MLKCSTCCRSSRCLRLPHFHQLPKRESERASERAGWHPLSPESPVADYGWLGSAHIKRLLTPLLSCLLPSPPLNPTTHPPAAMNGMTTISIELKTTRSDHQQPLGCCSCTIVRRSSVRRCFSRRPQTQFVQQKKNTDSCRDTFARCV